MPRPRRAAVGVAFVVGLAIFLMAARQPATSSVRHQPAHGSGDARVQRLLCVSDGVGATARAYIDGAIGDLGRSI